MTRIRVAMVGAGNMIEAHIRAFQAQNDVEIVGITNRTSSKAEQLAKTYGIPYVADDISSLISDTQANLVVMAVYEPAILPIAREGFVHDCAVLMEKPLGMNSLEAHQLAHMASSRSQFVFVGLNRRAMASTRAALADLNTRHERRFIHIQDQQSLATARAIGHIEAVVENWMYANSVHLVDYACTFGRGEVTKVKVLEPWTPDQPETVIAHITFSSGDTALYEAIWNGPGPWSCTVVTASKRWEMRPLEAVQFQNAGERKRNDIDLGANDSFQKPGLLHQAAQVCHAIRGQPNTAVKAQDALKTVQLLDDIYGLAS